MPESSDHPDEVDMSKFFVLPKQELQLFDFDNRGEWILDIGGGGEGIIGKLKGRDVIAIDRIKRELEETKNEALKIVMDVKELQFMDASFSFATAFFTFMYIPENDFEAVLSEVWRVLKPGGEFMIWDSIFAIPPEERKKKLAVILLKIHFPDGSFNDTGYGGVLRDQDISTVTHPAQKLGFKVIEKKTADYTFYVRLQKPR